MNERKESPQPAAGFLARTRRPYERPRVRSSEVFEAAAACGWNTAMPPICQNIPSVA